MRLVNPYKYALYMDTTLQFQCLPFWKVNFLVTILTNHYTIFAGKAMDVYEPSQTSLDFSPKVVCVCVCVYIIFSLLLLCNRVLWCTGQACEEDRAKAKASKTKQYFILRKKKKKKFITISGFCFLNYAFFENNTVVLSLFVCLSLSSFFF